MSMSMGTPIDGVVGGGFGVTRGGGVRGNLAMDNSGGQAETVLVTNFIQSYLYQIFDNSHGLKPA